MTKYNVNNILKYVLLNGFLMCMLYLGAFNDQKIPFIIYSGMMWFSVVCGVLAFNVKMLEKLSADYFPSVPNVYHIIGSIISFSVLIYVHAYWTTLAIILELCLHLTLVKEVEKIRKLKEKDNK